MWGDRSIVDGGHRDLRRTPADAITIVPARTGVARATDLVLQSMKGELNGAALRASVPGVRLVDLTVVVQGEPSADDVNAAFLAASDEGRLADLFEYTARPVISSEVVGSPGSCTFDAGITTTLGSMVKVTGWYDSVWGHSNRLVDLALVVGAAAIR